MPMTRIILRGCNGAMGQIITNIVKEDSAAKIVAGIDIVDNRENGYPVFTSIDKCQEIEADVVIDFSSPKELECVLDYCIQKKLPIVLCTTGLSEEQIERIKEESKKIAILKSANMSLGINTILKLVKEAAQVLGNADFDIEIVEKHHNKKVDAPSGTALALADSINESMNSQYEYIYDRSQKREKRQKKELGISSIRGGTIVGEHDVIFAGIDEVIEIRHTAYSKAIFAKGSISAAKFLHGKSAGFYSMSDVIG